MAGTSETLSVDEIVAINREQIEAFEGSFYGVDNLHNLNSLEYALGAIQAVVFGEPLHPTLAAKAAKLCYEIIAMHVFHDGNKRTGLATAQVFLQLNGYDIHFDTDEALQMTLSIATRAMEYEEVVPWFETRMVPFDLGAEPL